MDGYVKDGKINIKDEERILFKELLRIFNNIPGCLSGTSVLSLCKDY